MPQQTLTELRALFYEAPSEQSWRAIVRAVMAEETRPGPALQYICEHLEMRRDDWRPFCRIVPGRWSGERDAGESTPGVRVINAVGLGMIPEVWLPPGRFVMGSPLDELGRGHDETLRPEIVEEGFVLQATPTTQAAWDALWEATIARIDAAGQPCSRCGEPSQVPAIAFNRPCVGCGAYQPINCPRPEEIEGGRTFTHLQGRGRDNPAVVIRWHHALAFCNMRSLLDGLEPVYRTREGETYTWSHGRRRDAPIALPTGGWRLPSEVEWEYACRAGTITATWRGDLEIAGWNTCEPVLEEIAWYDHNSGKALQKVGLKAPNGWGLYDMLGNINEMCWEPFRNDIVNTSSWPHGIPGPEDALVVRGGSHQWPSTHCRAAYRGWMAPGAGYASIGIRLARTVRAI